MCRIGQIYTVRDLWLSQKPGSLALCRTVLRLHDQLSGKVDDEVTPWVARSQAPSIYMVSIAVMLLDSKSVQQYGALKTSMPVTYHHALGGARLLLNLTAISSPT